MFDWLASWFGQWTSALGGDVVNFVHWSVRAVTGWAGNIFRLVGRAWDDVFSAAGDLLAGIEHFAYRLYNHLAAILRHDLPWIYDAIVFVNRWIKRIFVDLWHAIVWYYYLQLSILHRTFNDVTGWVVRDIWGPLKRFLDMTWCDLLKWGYTAWYYITHPDKLAALIFWYIVSLLEVNAWEAAKLLGTFVTALFLHNIRRVALLLEDIISAVL